MATYFLGSNLDQPKEAAWHCDVSDISKFSF